MSLLLLQHDRVLKYNCFKSHSTARAACEQPDDKKTNSDENVSKPGESTEGGY